ncbi:MAG: hypothetical protein M3N10_03020 [Actinomycetota bacterium]|nr:hypothetical protein [Actinomycetota bacterium]
MAPEIAPDPKEQAVPLNTLEVRFTGGMLALNRFLMTLQNKRMPVAGFTVGRDADGMRATILLDCAPEMARRYTMLLSNLEDVQGVTPADEGMEVALLYTNGDWRESAERNGIKAHESDGTVVASGGPEALESWLSELGDEVEDIVRLGPMVRPGNGGA